MSFPLPDRTPIDPTFLIGVEGSAPHQAKAPVGGKAKRIFDIIISLVALALLAPLFLMLALLIKLSDGGPVFYRHPRLGFRSQVFPCLKFRTMVLNGDEVFPAYLNAHPEAAREWTETRKLKADPRVTLVGAVLRQLSLDEIPQLINIIRGEMSIVGPRPIVGEEVKLYGVHAAAYLRTRPGLTGVWQVSGRNDVSYHERAAMDRAYVENWSFGTDLVLIVKTIPAVITSRGSY